MKLRIKGNSVRLRLSKPEVEQLAVAGVVRETTAVGNSLFIYQLVKDDGNGLNAALQGSELTVTIPHGFANDWPVNNIVGIDNKLPGGALPGLYILVEKDFKCIDNSEEDQYDNYDNPKAC